MFNAFSSAASSGSTPGIRSGSRAIVACVALVGLLLTGLATAQTWRTAQDILLDQLRDRADSLAINLHEGISSDLQVLDDLVVAEQSVAGLDRTQFDAYADQTLSRHPELLGLAWVPRVVAADRERLENTAEAQGLSNFAIREQDADGRFVRADPRAEYFPVLYTGGGSASNGPWVGFDLASNPIRQRALVEADQMDQVSATSPITLFSGRGQNGGFLAFRRVRDQRVTDENGRPKLLGYVQATFATNRLIDGILGVHNANGLHLQIADVTSTGADDSPTPMYESMNIAVAPVIQQSTIGVGSRTWQLSTSPADESLIRPQVWTPLLVSAAGLLVTMLMITLLALGLAKTQLRRARQRAEMAEATRRSQEQFRALIENTTDVFIVTDQAGVVRYVSPSVERVLGYGPDEFVGGNLFSVVHPQDRGAIQQSLRRADWTHSDIDSHELQLRHADGSWKVVEATTHFLLWDPRLQGVVVTVRDITRRKDSENALHQLAYFDHLTQLPNRILLQDRLQAAIEGSQREHRSFALVVLDLDRFKEVNDTLGHAAGDELLREVARRLHAQAQGTETIARLGGDEFALLLPSVADEDAARASVRRFLEALEAPAIIEGTTIGIDASAGIALYACHGNDASTLLRCADVAMYAAKRDHLGVAVYQVGQDTVSTDDLGLYAELRTAITTGELVLYYQPKISLLSAEPESVEALVRWKHPQRGLVPPDKFIPLAERTGLMPALTRWVAAAALQRLRLWHEQGVRLSMCINLSPSALNDLELPSEIVRLVNVYGISTRHLVVEVTESAIMRDFERARQSLDCLRDAGIRISVDDFGTGQSSLAYLKSLPLDELKIDKSFVRDMLIDSQDEAIVRSVIELGHRLGLQVTAEGVEEPATFQALQRLGCDLAQGYWMGRPLVDHMLRDWFAEWDVRRREVASSAGASPMPHVGVTGDRRSRVERGLDQAA